MFMIEWGTICPPFFMDLSFLILGLMFFLDALSWVIIISILASWIAPMSHNPILIFLNETTNSVLAPIRKMVPPTGGFDWSPLIAIILLDILRRLVASAFL